MHFRHPGYTGAAEFTQVRHTQFYKCSNTLGEGSSRDCRFRKGALCGPGELPFWNQLPHWVLPLGASPTSFVMCLTLGSGARPRNRPALKPACSPLRIFLLFCCPPASLLWISPSLWGRRQTDNNVLPPNFIVERVVQGCQS